jgi:hypothetical protein
MTDMRRYACIAPTCRGSNLSKRASTWQRRLLDQVSRVERPPRVGRQPAMRPALQRWEAPLEQGFQRHPVAPASLEDELNSRLVAEQKRAVGDVLGWIGGPSWYGVRLKS